MTWAFQAIKNLGDGDGSAKLLQWTGGVSADGAAVGVELPEWADNCVQVTGTIGGATVTIEGSNDSTNGVDGTWGTLNNAQGTALSTATLPLGPKQIVERPRWIRPNVSGGTATALAVRLLLRRTNTMRT